MIKAQKQADLGIPVRVSFHLKTQETRVRTQKPSWCVLPLHRWKQTKEKNQLLQKHFSDAFDKFWIVLLHSRWDGISICGLYNWHKWTKTFLLLQVTVHDASPVDICTKQQLVWTFLVGSTEPESVGQGLWHQTIDHRPV